MLLGRTQWQLQRCRAPEEAEPWAFLTLFSSLNRWWHGWAARRLLHLHARAYRQGELFQQACYITSVYRFEMLIKAQRFNGRPSQIYSSQIEPRMYSFWRKSVYPRFLIEQDAFYKWRTATRAVKAKREAQEYIIEAIVTGNLGTTYPSDFLRPRRVTLNQLDLAPSLSLSLFSMHS
jgi:hypothetical protein